MNIVRDKTMIRIGTLLYLLIVATCLCGCRKEVMIRVANRSDVELRDVVVRFPSQTERYGDIPPGKTTEYRKVSKAYSYARIRAVIDGKEVVLQPTDYVGERLLSGGNYTYSLRHDPKATDKRNSLWLELERE
jgi:hypothetical protein